MVTKALKSYPIKGGAQGRNRLSVIARILEPTTEALLRRAGLRKGITVVDAGCGGGDVTFTLARLVGRDGHVTAIDLDEEKLTLARAEAETRAVTHVKFEAGDVTAPWPVKDADMVFARFILTHLPHPMVLLREAMAALKPGGVIVVEDIDLSGRFSYPECASLDTAAELYMTLSRRRGGDPTIGRRLSLLLEEAGFDQVETTVVQPFSRKNGAKDVAVLTFAAVADGLKAEGLANAEEIAWISRDIEEFNRRPDTIVSLPRIFQAWGRKV
jgi:trans-aconitate 2-methyltransferase